MARLWHTGFEINSSNTGVEFDSSTGSPSISSTNFRSGAFAGRVSSLSSGAAKAWRQNFLSANGDGAFFFRFYFRVDTYPSAENRIFVLADSAAFDTSTPKVYITVDSAGLLRLYDEDGVIGSPSAALVNDGTWYRVELKFDRTLSAGSHVVEALIDGVSFASASNRNIAAGIQGINIGGNLGLEAQTTGDWYFDDVAINDSTGSFENSYPGSGKIIRLFPTAAGDSNQWLKTAGGAGDSSNYQLVDEVIPNDATDFVQSSNLNDVDMYNVTNSGIGSSDTVKLVSLGARFRNDVADATTSFRVRIEKTSGGTISESASIVPNSTSWLTNSIAVPKNLHLLSYQDPDGASWLQSTIDSMQIGLKLILLGVNKVQVSTLIAMIEYTPAPPSGFVPKIISI